MAISYTDVATESAAATDTTIYTASNVTSAHILAATAFNRDSSNQTITVNIVQSGESAANSNKYISVNVPAGRSMSLSNMINLTLKDGDFISVIASAADSINLKLSIKEISS